MPYYRAELGGNPPYEEGQGLDLTDSTLSLNVASTSEYGGAKVDGETIGINSQGQLFALQEQTITLSGTTSSVAVGGTDTITATASGGGIISATSSNTSVATVSVSNGEITITGVSEGSCTIIVSATATRIYGPGEATISSEVVGIHIYGAEWDGSSSSIWSRTDDAASFIDPNPYYSGMSGTPSSPFDNLKPWSEIRIVEDDNAGTLVEIPKFWYKWTKNGSSIKLQISNGEQTGEGWHVSPAHADRGDNVGERDYVYVGRYHCASTYKSISSVTPVANYSRAEFRTSIHNLGSYIWQNDFAMFWTIRMLYLVEFANWNSQSKIGYGCSPSGSIASMGYTDSMPYHTGTTQTSRTTYGGTQYRYIEGLWDNIYDFIDGIRFDANGEAYITKNPADFNDSTGGDYAFSIWNSGNHSGWIYQWTQSLTSGLEYVFYPSGGYYDDVYKNMYVCDYSSHSGNSYNRIVFVGGEPYQTERSGMFCFNSDFSSYSTGIGSRLMVLPPSRLSPPTS